MAAKAGGPQWTHKPPNHGSAVQSSLQGGGGGGEIQRAPPTPDPTNWQKNPSQRAQPSREQPCARPLGWQGAGGGGDCWKPGPGDTVPTAREWKEEGLGGGLKGDRGRRITRPKYSHLPSLVLPPLPNSLIHLSFMKGSVSLPPSPLLPSLGT